MTKKLKLNVIRSTGITLIILFIFSIASMIYINLIKDNITEETYTYLSEMTSQSAAIVTTQVSGDLRAMQSIATLMGGIEEPFSIQKYLPVLEKESYKQSFKRMGIIDLNGVAYSSDGKTANFLDRLYYHDALAGKTVVSDTLTDKFDGNDINVYATPIYQNAQIVAVLFATNNTDLYADVLSVSTFQGAGYTFIVKRDGTPIVKPGDAQSADMINLFDFLQNATFFDDTILTDIKSDMSVGKSGIVKYRYNQVDEFLNYEPLSINDWYVLSVVPAKIVNEKSNYITNTSLLFCILITVVLCCLVLIILRDQSKTRKALKNLAFGDKLTGYSNWNKFELDCNQLLKTDHHTKYAMIAFDINKFKVINDLYGHATGNTILRDIAKIVSMNLTADETFARVTADNFNLLVQYTDDDQIIFKIKSLYKEIQQKNKANPLTISFGVYKIIDPSLTISAISDRASIAKRTVKGSHDLYYSFYSGAVRDQILLEKEIENEMEAALKNGEFEVYLQPKHSIVSGKPVGAEALIRWNHPIKGFCAPAVFIPLFEKNGFVRKIDMFVLTKICENFQSWFKRGFPTLVISVNMSRIHLHNPNFVGELCAISEQYDVPKELIELEITESAVLEFDDNNSFLNIIMALKQKGFKIAMDDFGTGYSSLNILREIPVDVLKLDREFFGNSSHSERGRVVISDVVAMAKHLNMTIVAEGVETKRHIDFLSSIGCDIVQGYYYSKPMPISRYEQFIEELL